MNHQPPHTLFLEPAYAAAWTSIINSNFGDLESLKFSAAARKFLLEKILAYYRCHVEGFGQIRSHEVLEEVMG